MEPILIHFSKYLPSIHIIDRYYSILSSSEFAKNEEMTKSDEKLFSSLLKSVKTSTDSFYI